MSTPCTCPLAGYCDRHQRMKTGRIFELCKTDIRYFDLWERQKNETLDDAKSARRARIKEAVEKDKRLIGWLRVLKHPGEKGAGDTAQRMVVKRERPSDATAALERLFKQCSCSRVDAVARLNRDWPW